MTVLWTNQFKRDYRKAIKRHDDIAALDQTIRDLASGKKLSKEKKDHALTGEYAGFRECHIHSDFLLIYAIKEGRLLLVLARTGSHSELFAK